MIGNLLSDQPITPKRTAAMVPPGMGELNYLQSLIASIANQELNTTASPTFVGATFTGLTASLPIVTDANKALASVAYATFKASLAIAQADVTGLTIASSPTFAGMTLSGLTASLPVVTDANKLLASMSYATFKTNLAITYSDVGAEASGAVATHAALITGVHGLVFTAGKALTLQKSMTLTAADDTGVYTLPTGTKTILATTGSPAAMVIASQATGDLLYASSPTAWARLGIGAAGKALVVNAGGTLPEWGTVLTNPMDAQGQLIYGGAAGAPTKLAAGTATYLLQTTGAAGSETPGWVACTGTGAPMRNIDPTIGAQTAATNVTLYINSVVNKAARIKFQQSGSDKWIIGNGAASEDNKFALYNSVTGLHPLTVDPTTDNVGIKQTSPGASLHVGGTGDAFRLQNLAASNALYLTWYNSAGTRTAYFGRASGANDDITLANETSGRHIILLPTAGSVGIGTTPTANSPLRISGLPTSNSGLVSGEVWISSNALYIVP